MLRKFKVNVNGEEFKVEVEEIASEGKAKISKVEKVKSQEVIPNKKKSVVSSGGTEVKAPLPGVISSIEVKEGDSVSEGDVLFILEAMKMENEIAAPASGTIKSVLVKSGTDVTTDEVLAIIG